MEDLFKVLPLTIQTKSVESQRVIFLQFDSLTDLQTADQILTLLNHGNTKTKQTKTVTKSILNQLISIFSCRKQTEESSSQDTVDLGVQDQQVK